jgi:hypothetical protein
MTITGSGFISVFIPVVSKLGKFKGSEYLNPAHQSHLIITKMELHYATHTKSCCSVIFKYSDPLNSDPLKLWIVLNAAWKDNSRCQKSSQQADDITVA